MINTKKAFTLVELIVVITILAILGTIAFISLQGYSADARNSKRTNDLNNIAGSINIKTTEGIKLIGFASDTANQSGTLPDIAGAISTSDDYIAGKPNYTALWIKEDDFKDPQGDYYPIGITTRKNGQFEIAASMENGNGDKTAKVNGTFKSRLDNATNVFSTWTLKITINPSDINKFSKGDFLTDNWGTNTGEIIKISSDGVTLTLINGSTVSGTGIQLFNTEEEGLINSFTNSGTYVTNDWTDLPY